MQRYLILYTAGSEEHTDAILTLLRYMRNAHVLEISDKSPIGLADKWVYELDVLNETADAMLGQLCLEDVIDYRATLDDKTVGEIDETHYPEGDDFMEGRIGFAIVDGEVRFMNNIMTGYTTMEWLHWCCLVAHDEAKEVIRGSFNKHAIRIFRGDDWKSIDMHEVSAECMKVILEEVHRWHGIEQIEVYNGVIPGIPGTEWNARVNEGLYSLYARE